jgi:hypothetical protein
MDLEIDIETLIPATVSVSEEDGRPMTAIQIAFLLDVPRREAIGPLMLLGRTGRSSWMATSFACDDHSTLPTWPRWIAFTSG